MNGRTCVAAAIALLIAGSPVFAQDAKGGSASASEKTSAGPSLHKAVGVVKKIDAKAGTATIEHGPVQSLNWPGMTMPFTIKDSTVLGKLEVGRKIAFEFERRGTQYVIVRVN